MEVTIFFAGYGVMEDNGTVWANAQMLTEFEDHDSRSGCAVAKIDISTDNNNAVAKRLVGELQRAKTPIKCFITTGAKAKGGKVSTVIKEFRLLDDKSPQINKPLGSNV